MVEKRNPRLFLPFVVLLFVVPTVAFSELPHDSLEMFSDESLQAIARSVIADSQALSAEVQPQTQSYRPYWIVYAWLAAATIYDVETTFYLLDRCDYCQEQNPITKPFIERGRLATYLFSAAIDGVVMYIAKRMYDRSDPWWRIIPVTLAVVHGIAGTWNIYQSTRPTEHP